MRVPPNVVRSTTMPSGSAAISPITAAAAPSGWPRRAASAASDSSAGRRRRACPRWRRRADRCPGGRRRRSPPAAPATPLRRARPRARCRAPARWRWCRRRPRRVAHPAGVRCRLEQRAHEVAERRGVGADVGLEREVAACEHHRHAVIGERARHEHAVARPAPAAGPSARPAGITPTPAVVMNRPSAAPRPTTFVSPVTICHARRAERRRPCRPRSRAARQPGTPLR